jgi:hypothetical protein
MTPASAFRARSVASFRHRRWIASRKPGCATTTSTPPEGKKYQVFPLDASVAARVIAPRPNITAGRSEFVYTRPMTGLPQGDSPLLLDCFYTITADITVPEGGAEGMILTVWVWARSPSTT